MNLESTIQEYILPEIENDAERTERLITVVESLSEKQRLAFTALVRKQKASNENMQRYVKLCKNNVSFRICIE
jgi:sister-chromatid-cohesion protein PDS5